MSSDISRLYRRIIYRNNILIDLLVISRFALEKLVMYREKLIQEDMGTLLDNRIYIYIISPYLHPNNLVLIIIYRVEICADIFSLFFSFRLIKTTLCNVICGIIYSSSSHRMIINIVADLLWWEEGGSITYLLWMKPIKTMYSNLS